MYDGDDIDLLYEDYIDGLNEEYIADIQKGNTMNDQVVQEVVVPAGKPAEFTKLNLDPVAPATQEADAERSVQG